MKPENSGNNGSRSSSELLRQEGNELYIKVSKGNLGPSLARRNLQKAQELYEEALGVSQTYDNGASCYKNLGALNWLWGKREWAIYQEELAERKGKGGAAAAKFLGALTWLWGISEWANYQEESTAQKEKEGAVAGKFRMTRCLEFYFKAFHYGSLAMKQRPWLTQIEDTLSKIVNWSANQLYTHSASFEPVMRVLCETVACSEADWSGRRRMAVVLYKIHAEFMLRRGIKSLKCAELSSGSSERGGYKKCLNATRDCYRPLERAESILCAAPMGDKELVKQVIHLKKKVSNWEMLCEAIQSRIQGEELLEKAMRGDMDIIWEAIDYFKHSLREKLLENEAIALSRIGKSYSFVLKILLENEAIALSRIGKSYSCVLKMKKQAHPFHLQSIRIAHTIMSARIASADWYICSSEAVKKHQEEVVEPEIRENAENGKAGAERMNEMISAVQAEKNKSAESFLKYIYENFPHPDVTKQVLPSLEGPENVKAALRKTIVAYHPDRNRQQSDDWQVLCEEITKILNNKYENYK